MRKKYLLLVPALLVTLILGGCAMAAGDGQGPDWTYLGAIGLGMLWLTIGCALRAFVPYLTTGLTAIGDSGSWASWPKFEPKYLTTFAMALLGYILTLVTVPGAAQVLVDTLPLAAIGLGYAGGALVRDVAKLAFKRLR